MQEVEKPSGGFENLSREVLFTEAIYR